MSGSLIVKKAIYYFPNNPNFKKFPPINYHCEIAFGPLVESKNKHPLHPIIIYKFM